MDKKYDFSSAGISTAEALKVARLAELAAVISLENMHDGSARALEYAQLALSIIDDYLHFMEGLLDNPFLPDAERIQLQAHHDDFLARRVKAERAVELNRQARRPS